MTEATAEITRVDASIDSGKMWLQHKDLVKTPDGLEQTIDDYANTADQLPDNHPDKPQLHSRIARLYLVAAFSHPKGTTERQEYIDDSHDWAADVIDHYSGDDFAPARRDANSLLAVIAVSQGDLTKAKDYLASATDGVSYREQPYEAQKLNLSLSQLLVERNNLLLEQQNRFKSTDLLPPDEAYRLELINLAITYKRAEAQAQGSTQVDPSARPSKFESPSERKDRDKAAPIELAMQIAEKEMKLRGMTLTDEQMKRIQVDHASAPDVLLDAGIDVHSSSISYPGEPGVITRRTIGELETNLQRNKEQNKGSLLPIEGKFLPSQLYRESIAVYDPEGNLYLLLRETTDGDELFTVKPLRTKIQSDDPNNLQPLYKEPTDQQIRRIPHDEFIQWTMETIGNAGGQTFVDASPEPELEREPETVAISEPVTEPETRPLSLPSRRPVSFLRRPRWTEHDESGEVVPLGALLTRS